MCGSNWMTAAGVKSLFDSNEQANFEHQMVKTQVMSARVQRVISRKNQKTPQSYNSSRFGQK